MRGCFDSVILIDHLRGIGEADLAIDSYDEHFISIVTWIEVMAAAGSPAEEQDARATLGKFAVIDLDAPVASIASSLRRETRLKLPDAIIMATARHLRCSLVTRNTKDFPADDPWIRVPYRI